MRLIRFLYAPGKVFAETKKNSWVLPLAAAVILSMLSWILMASAVGEREILRRVLEANPRMAARYSSTSNFRPYLVWFIVAAGGLTALKAVIIAGSISLVFRLLREATIFGDILAVCSYSAYFYELVDFIVKRIAVVVYGGHAHVPPAGGIPTDATVFLNRVTTAGRLHAVASSLDLLTIGSFLLIGFGLSKTIPKMHFSRAALVAMVPWLIWVIPKVAYVKPPAG